MTVLLNISRSPLFCDKIALNFMKVKFIWRRSLRTFCTEFGLFRISTLESSETFQMSDAEPVWFYSWLQK